MFFRGSFLRVSLTVFTLTSCLGCQITYYLHSAYHQSVLANSREPIDKVLRKSSTTEEERRKLKLVQEVKAFSEKELGLKASQNYTSYVKLDDPYVTYIVQVAYAEELKPYLWRFPFIGDVPYKGYFVKSMAVEEAASFPKDKYDTFIRGVSAYSTLGWFQDSVLSTMLRYEDYELVEILIHETVHTTLYIKSAAEFNERMATFLGQEGMKIFYRQKEGDNAKALAKAEDDTHDQKLFSAFVTKELEDLKKWYIENKGKISKELKTARLKEIQTRFAKELKPKLKTENYREFERRELNNALLLAYQTYEYSLADFQKLFDHFGHDFKKTLEWLKGLEKEPKPDQTLKDFVSSLK
ncbi:MAG: aminopeptidase [Bdellovibrionales bacterium]